MGFISEVEYERRLSDLGIDASAVAVPPEQTIARPPTPPQVVPQREFVDEFVDEFEPVKVSPMPPPPPPRLTTKPPPRPTIPPPTIDRLTSPPPPRPPKPPPGPTRTDRRPAPPPPQPARRGNVLRDVDESVFMTSNFTHFESSALSSSPLIWARDPPAAAVDKDSKDVSKEREAYADRTLEMVRAAGTRQRYTPPAAPSPSEPRQFVLASAPLVYGTQCSCTVNATYAFP